MLKKIRNSRFFKGLALYLIFSFIAEIISPSMSFALTGGPSQPEVESFSPIGTSEMVDVFSGDFNYNIPLMDVGGYPINMAYNSGVTMDQEASWVGLGWNLNVGSITRGLRGLPDDFKGDEVEKEFNLKDNETFGVTAGLSTEIFGWDAGSIGLGYNFGINYNNYTGVGAEQSISPSVSLGKQNESGMNINMGFSIKSNSDGLNLSPSVSLSAKEVSEKDNVVTSLSAGANIGATFNSRQGLLSVNSGLSVSHSQKEMQDYVKKNGEKGRYIKDFSSAGKSVGSSVSFTNNTYVPQVSMPKHNYSVSMQFTFDAALFGTDFGIPISAYYSKSSLINEEKSIPSYGYVYAEHGTGKTPAQNVLLDFNREKDQPFTQNTPNLPLTNFSYDQFQVSGQGVAGQYRAYRNDVGYVHDNFAYNTSASDNLGVEIGSGNTADVGVNVNISSVQTNTGNWWGQNQMRDKLSFSKKETNDLFEPFHFKQVGELSVDNDPDFLEAIGGTNPVKVDIQRFSKFDHRAVNQFVDRSLNEYEMNSPLKRNKRVQRNQAMTFLTKEEVPHAGFEGYVSNDAEDHHISEVSILRPDGARYIYGIPAYNKSKRDVTFNATGLTASCSTGEVTYDPSNGDNTVNNELGRDHFYQADITPAYSHSFLLTSIVSSDYVDIDGVPGPSEDDLGSYTKFNYDADPNTSGIQPQESNYRWRVPFNENSASYSEGLKADNLDDKGSYSYGEKELWYIKTIETKTHVAEFHVSERRDAKGVADEDGGMGTSSMYKLDSIRLYSRESYKKKENQEPNIFPIKTVHFEYDYDLCPNIENNDGTSEWVNGENINSNEGKLTLRKVYFTYEDSKIGALSPYEFLYGDSNHDGTEESALNREYNLKGYDRWGNYKDNDGTSCTPTSTNVSVPEFPYVEQDQSTVDENTAMWTMTDILLPSGGKISLDYESDDYAYVQDKPAMQMFKVQGLGTSSTYDSNNELYQSGTSPEVDGESDFVYIDLPQEWIDHYSSSPSTQNFQNDFTDWIINKAGGNLYFKFLTEIDGISKYEYVPGYAKIIAAGICSGDPTKGYIQVDTEKREAKGSNSTDVDKEVNPFSKAAWQFTQSYLPRIAYDLPDPTNPIGAQLAQALLSTITPVAEFFRGPNNLMRERGFAKEIDLNRSFIRLQNPTKRKLGGGVRVKKIRTWDNWDDMTSTEQEADYGQQYEYTTLEEGRVISSGVASYEPLVGGDENPFRQPITFTDEQLMGPKRENYLETPFGESFFPSPSIGYSKVTVKNLVREDGGGSQNVTRHATGRIVHEFYTAKDFPTRVDYTNLKPLKDKTSIVGQVLGAGLRDHMTVSQGYTVELNDMHGKQKAQWVYQEDKNTAISGVEYKYHTKEESYSIPLLGGETVDIQYQTLDNNVSTVNKDGSVEEKEIGVEVDFITDFRQSYNYSVSAGAQFNLATFLTPIPITIPTVFPSFSSSETKFRSTVSTKVVNRFGILKETIAHDLGSSVSTNNLAYDAETGDILLTQTYNEFEDPIYSFKYPAHWAYEKMGQAYKNIGASVSVATNSNGATSAQSILIAGDEVLLGSNNIAWVWDDDETDNTVYLIDQYGDPIQSYSGSAKVIRSGRRNQQQIQIGEITSLQNPIVGTTNKSIEFNGSTEILNASSIEYDERWGSNCDAFGQKGISYSERTFEAPQETSDSCRLTDWAIEYFRGLNAPQSKNVPCILFYDGNDVYYPSQITSIQPVLPLDQNTDQFEIEVTATVNGSQLTLLMKNRCGNELWVCDDVIEVCDKPTGEIVNPYVTGIRGNWRSLKSWTYLNDRTHSGISSTDPDQQYDGVFLGFTPFWEEPTLTDSWTTNPTDWTWAAEATEFSPYGNQLESMDALNRYSAEILGYNQTLVTAVGNNADFNQIAFDGFEDYAFESYEECCPGHFNFHEYEAWLTEDESHTGRWSMEIPASQSIDAKRSFTDTEPTAGVDDVPYTIKDEDIIGTFGPNTYKGAQTYVLSYWVKKENTNNEAVFDYPELEPIVSINGSNNEINSGYTSKSGIIDGWQHVEVSFSVAANVSGNIEVRFENNSTTTPHFVDDVRIHPFNSNMKSYVYDPVSFRLWAELDERNFATFYEYDENGTLLRIKKETEKGVYTIQESRQGKKKSF